MKLYLLLLLTFGMLGTFPLRAEVQTITTTSGTVSEFVPGTSFVMTEPSGPVTYQYAPNVVYTTSAGAVIPQEEVVTRIHTGSPVRVHYITQGDRRMVERVIVEDRPERVHVRRHVRDRDDDDK